MVVAADTFNPTDNGSIYSFDRGHALGEVAIAPVPEWLFDWLLAQDVKRHVAHRPIRPRQFDGKVGCWARKVIDDELKQLAATPEGARNHALATVSFRLGRLVGGGETDSNEVLEALHQIAHGWPTRHRSYDTIERAFAAGMTSPRQAPLRHVVWVVSASGEKRS